MHTDNKYVLLDHRTGGVVISSNSRDDLLDKATEFTLNGSGATYSIYEHTVQISNKRVATYTESAV